MVRLRTMLFRTVLVLSASAIALMAGGCGDDDDPISSQTEHLEAIGMVVYQSGSVVMDYFGPDYLASDTVAYNDTLRASQGLNPHWEVKFYDEDTVLIDPPESDDHHLNAVFGNSSLAELWWHEGEEGEFEFHMRGLAAGTTTVRFQVMHIDHADFSTLPVPLIIDDQVLHDAPIGVKLHDEESGDLLATAWLADSSKATGTIQLQSGTTTDHIEAIFFDEYGTEFWPGVPPHSLVVTSSDSSVARITGQEPDEPWAFRVQGAGSGTCTITVYIYHDDHIGKTFTPITVQVD